MLVSTVAAAVAAQAATTTAAQEAKGRGHRLVLQQPDMMLQHATAREARGRGHKMLLRHLAPDATTASAQVAAAATS